MIRSCHVKAQQTIQPSPVGDAVLSCNRYRISRCRYWNSSTKVRKNPLCFQPPSPIWKQQDGCMRIHVRLTQPVLCQTYGLSRGSTAAIKSGMHKTSKKLPNYEAIGYPRKHGTIQTMNRIIDAFPELYPIINSRMKIMEEP